MDDTEDGFAMEGEHHKHFQSIYANIPSAGGIDRAFTTRAFHATNSYKRVAMNSARVDRHASKEVISRLLVLNNSPVLGQLARGHGSGVGMSALRPSSRLVLGRRGNQATILTGWCGKSLSPSATTACLGVTHV